MKNLTRKKNYIHYHHWKQLFEKLQVLTSFHYCGGRRGRDRMILGYTTTYAISAYHH